PIKPVKLDKNLQHLRPMGRALENATHYELKSKFIRSQMETAAQARLLRIKLI
ncbi:hypothetical protein GPALN_004049, partial [Globodera pallida]